MDLRHIAVGKFTPSFSFMKLIKFNGVRIPDFLKKFKGRKVSEVIRKVSLRPVFLGTSVPFITWKGSTETEYFVSNFYGGMVMMDVQEREILLAQEDFYIIALAPTLGKLNDSSITIDQFTQKINLNAEYLIKGYVEDIENIQFNDIMKVMGWKYISKKVIEEDFCFDS